MTWLESEVFLELKNERLVGFPYLDYVLARKLMMLKHKLNEWRRKRDVLSKLDKLETMEVHKFKLKMSFNVSFIALIPKKARAMDMKDFRPISFVCSLLKFISKLSAERFKCR